MKYTTGLLLVVFTLSKATASLPADHGKSHPFDPDHPIEYSLEELNTFFDQQESGSVFEKQVDKKISAELDTVSGTGSQGQAGSKFNLAQDVELKYNAMCSFTDYIEDSFFFKVLYDGKDVTFRRNPLSNIDAWGQVFVNPVRSNRPIFAEVPFHHLLCKPMSRKKVCSYYFSGVAQANIKYYGANPGITPDAAQPMTRSNVAYVSQTCNDKPGPNGKIACPAPTGPHCWLNDISVIKGYTG